MDFKKIYNDHLNNLGSIGKLSEESFLNYVNKYSVIDKSEDLKNVLTGKFFTFYYRGSISQGQIFINRRPVLFITSTYEEIKQGILKGIDIVLLTPLDRLNFMIRFCSIFKSGIGENDRRKKENIGYQMPLKINRDIIGTLFGGINYKHTYYGFDLNKVVGLKEITSDDWKNIIYLDTKSIEGTTLQEIYNKLV